MELKHYLRKAGKTQQEFATDLGVSQGLVSQWINAVTEITPEMAVRIEQATEGKVTRYKLRPDIFGKPAREIRPYA